MVLAFSLLTLTGLTVARYLVEEFTAPPPKPIFAEEQAPPPTDPPKPVAQNPEKTIVAPPPSPTPSPSNKPKGKAARVNWAEGLSLRSSPDGQTTGGVDYNTEVIILETSADGNWQKVWVNGQEGWIKAGNVDLLPE